MSRRYSFDEEQEPYFNANPPQQPLPTSEPPPYIPPPTAPLNPAAHPASAFGRLRHQRQQSQDPTSPFDSVPVPPPHRETQGRAWGRDSGNTNSAFSQTTPGADNFGEQAAGGIAGIAYGVADAHARESGLEAMRNTPGYDPRMEERYDPYEEAPRPGPQPQNSHSSLTPLTAAVHSRGISASPARSMVSQPSYNHEPYVDQHYRYSRNVDPELDRFDPNTIEDDGDDGLEYRSGRGSTMSLGHSGRNSVPAAGAAGVLGGLGAFVGRKVSGQPGPQYDAVRDAYSGGQAYNLGDERKSEWLAKQSTGRSRLRCIVWVAVVIIIIGAIAGGIAGGILSKKNSSSASNTPSGASANSDAKTNGDLDANSAEIKKLMNNPNLHKVFPGIDYTPMYTQYPGCLSYPASQNNVTRDLAVLSQLTNTIRLYGTDCNQTEMLLHSIDQLNLKSKVKVWMGVWQDSNATTNARQLAQMYDIFKTYGADQFVGVIVGNEVLYRKDMTATQLGTVISGVRANLTAMGINIPIASSDLGDDWTSELATEVDYVMANIHPFFAGVTADVAASWTWNFWQSHDVILKADASKNIISETGWPSIGGTDCGGAATCTTGSVAGIAQMNTFMGDWVCQALGNGTNYFWFEAFDEPWKITYDTPGQGWEDHWGLMDVNRNLKPGVVIPNCGGKTVS